jgi:hypothetical protein
MAYSISVIMLVDELIANLLNIHNQQFLLNNNKPKPSELKRTTDPDVTWFHRLLPVITPKSYPTHFLSMTQPLKGRTMPRYGRGREQAVAHYFDTTWIPRWMLEGSSSKRSSAQCFASGFEEYIVQSSIPFPTSLCKHSPIEAEKLDA